MRAFEMDVDSSSKFIASLTKFLQSLCNGYVDFENGVELVGHIYLSVDTGKKIDYILHEKVCKNDENSVTFISNSFHAQPLDKTKSQTKQQVDTCKGKTRSDKVREVDKEETVGRKDEEEDVVIVNATKGSLENNDGASMGTRGRKRHASPTSEQQFQRPFRRNAEASISSPSSSSAQQTGQSGSGVLGSNGLRRKAPPSATITSQEDQTDSFSSSDLKLEHMTTDELLSLASQVSDSSCSASIIPPVTGSGSRSAGGDPSNQQVWVKQEAPDDDDSCLASGSGDSAHGQSWPLGRDPQNDTNTGSGGLYPVMLHQNTAAFPGPGGPFPAGFPPLSGGPSSSQHPAFTQQSSSQAAANLFASPVPGTSQGGGTVDSAGHTDLDPGSVNFTNTLLNRLSRKIEEQSGVLQSVFHKVNQITLLFQDVDVLATAALPDGLSLPLTSQQEADRLEEDLMDKGFRTKLVKHLSCIGGDSVTSLVRRILNRLFSKDLSVKYNFTGAKGKKSFQSLQLRSVLIAAVRKTFASTSETEVDVIARKWFGNARDRDGGRTRRAMSSNGTPPLLD